MVDIHTAQPYGRIYVGVQSIMYHMAWDMSGSRKDVCSAIVLVCDTSVCLTIRIFQFHIDERMCRSVWQRNCGGFKWLHLSRMLAGLVVFQCFLSIFSFFFLVFRSYSYSYHSDDIRSTYTAVPQGRQMATVFICYNQLMGLGDPQSEVKLCGMLRTH